MMRALNVAWFLVLYLPLSVVATEQPSSAHWDEAQDLIDRMLSDPEAFAPEGEFTIPEGAPVEIDMERFADQLREIQSEALSDESIRDMSDILDQAPDLEDSPHAQSAFEAFQENVNELHEQRLERLVGEARTAEHEQQGIVIPNHGATVVFLSIHAAPSDIHVALEEAAYLMEEGENVRLAVRGIREDHDHLYESVVYLAEMATEYDPTPPLVIDPGMFEEHGIDQAPHILVFDENENVIVQAPGVLSPINALNARDEEAEKDSPEWPVFLDRSDRLAEIEEQDLIERIIRSYAELDLERQAQVAMERYWANYDFIELSKATRNQTYRIDPTIFIEEPIVDELSGRVIRAAGEIINPLHQRPFRTVLIVFDARDERQVEVARELQREAYREHPGKRVQMLTTHVDLSKNHGWGHFEPLNRTFNDQTFLLQPEIAERFHIQATPSVVTADQDYFYVREVDINDPIH